jgi:hypothetical protein
MIEQRPGYRLPPRLRQLLDEVHESMVQDLVLQIQRAHLAGLSLPEAERLAEQTLQDLAARALRRSLHLIPPDEA